MSRCPKCHLAYIPEETKTVWIKKFDTIDYPHRTAICNLCNIVAGKHISPNWQCPTGEDEPKETSENT